MIVKAFWQSLSMAVVLMATLVLTTGVSVGDHVWFEVPDAPDGPLTFQDTVGFPGPLEGISGFTDAGSGDFRDSFSIVITDPAAFYATTSSAFGAGTGFADFDTRLMLWNLDGTGVMANDDITPGGAPFLSLISDPGIYAGLGGVVDPGVPTLAAGQKYILTITGFNDNAFDGAGADIFSMGADFDALHDNQGNGPWASWAPGGATGNYNIELGGATFCRIVPEPASATLLAIGAFGMLVVRRRK